MNKWIRQNILAYSKIFSTSSEETFKIKTIETGLLISNIFYSLYFLYYLLVEYNFSIVFFLISQLIVSILIYFFLKRKLLGMASILFVYLQSFIYLLFPFINPDLSIIQLILIANLGLLTSLSGILIYSFSKERILFIISISYSIFTLFIGNFYELINNLIDFKAYLGLLSFKVILLFLYAFSFTMIKEYGIFAMERARIFFRKSKIKNQEYNQLKRSVTLALEEKNSNLELLLAKNEEQKVLIEEIIHQRNTYELVLKSFKAQEQELKGNYEKSLNNERIISQQYEELISYKNEIDKQNKEILNQKKVLESKNNLLETYSRVIMILNKSTKVTKSTFHKRIKEIITTCGETLKVTNSSVWQFDQMEKSIKCVFDYNRTSGNFESGEVINSESHPEYFKYILTQDVLKVTDVKNHPSTKDFNEQYLSQKNIFAMLDTPFYVNGSFKGILCFEQADETREWTNEEVFFCKSIAEITSNCYMELQSSINELQIESQTEEMLRVNDILEQKNQEIENIRLYLERKLEKSNLEVQDISNKLYELSKVTYIDLKVHLHRIQGINNLLQINNENNEENRKCVEFINTSLIDLSKGIDNINNAIIQIANITSEQTSESETL